MEKWSDEPKTTDKVIMLFRNFCADEYLGILIYKKLKPFKDWTVPDVLNFVLKEGSTEQYDFLQNIYQRKIKSKELLPFARSIHHFLSKHDKEWYEKVYKANTKL